MVRRDDEGHSVGDPDENPSSRCEDPAGASPVSVSGNAPSSRLPARGETPASEAERREPGNRRKPLTGKQARGPQLEVKTAASSDPPSERVGCEPAGRAAHVTAKATPPERDSHRDGGLGGVRVAARVQGSSRNTREPSAQPASRQGASYKSTTKSNTAQRKSEGIIVPPAPERRVRKLLGELRLELDPGKTRRVDLGWGKHGIDFLGCHLRKRFSGPVWEKSRKRVYFLHRWPSTKSMKRIRQRVKDLTTRSRCHQDPRDVIAELNPVLRGWGQYFRTGNAADKFNEIDRYVTRRLKRMRVERKGSHLKPDEARRWNGSYFHALGLHPLMGSVRYPEAA